jgi:hypothetical protein
MPETRLVRLVVVEKRQFRPTHDACCDRRCILLVAWVSTKGVSSSFKSLQSVESDCRSLSEAYAKATLHEPGPPRGQDSSAARMAKSLCRPLISGSTAFMASTI